MASTEMTLKDLSSLKITITIPKTLRLRMKIGLWLMKLGIRVFGATPDVKRWEP